MRHYCDHMGSWMVYHARASQISLNISTNELVTFIHSKTVKGVCRAEIPHVDCRKFTSRMKKRRKKENLNCDQGVL